MNFSLKTLEYDKVLTRISQYAKSIYGRERVLELEPSKDYDEVKRLLEETEEARLAIIKSGDLPFDNFDGVLKFIELAKKGGVIEAIDFLKIVNLINNYNNIKKYLEQLPSSHEVLDIYFENEVNLQKLKSAITLAINLEGKVLDQASKELFQIRRKIGLTENRIRQTLNTIMHNDSAKLQEFLIVIRDGRMCLPYKIEYKNSINGILHDISQSNTTCYIEPRETLVLANELDSYYEEERVEIRNILLNLSLLVSANSQELLEILNSIVSLEVIFAKGKYASFDYIKPTLTQTNEFNIDNVCHPLIDKDVCVPLSLRLKEEDKAVIITGPNTGGKTVALKTVGMTNLLVQTGIFVDRKRSSTYHVYSHILADIGDEQSIEESLSTFSSHMKSIIEILNKPLNNALIILDELGSGTDPKEGSALAIAIIEKMISLGAKLLVSTHYTDLKNYAYKNKGVLNASVEFNVKTLKPTYKLLLGVPGQSNALLIASELGLRQDIIDDSYKFLNKSDDSISLELYEEKLAELKVRENEIIELEEKTKLGYEKLLSEKAKLEQNRLNLLRKAEKEAEHIIEEAKNDSRKLLDEIKKIKNEAEIKDHILAELRNKSSNLNVNKKVDNIFDEELFVGDYVLIKSYNKNGYITKIKKDRYEVDFGQFTMDFKKSDLIKTAKPKAAKEKRTLKAGYNSISGASMSLDLRGKRYEEVKDLLEEFLDKAMLQNYEQVSIIHGYGTGVVRKRVWELLKINPNVKEYRYGKEGEGLNGATIVNLK